MVILQPSKWPGDFYDTMQVCIKNGHKVTELYDTAPEERQANCHICGSKTTTQCTNCEAKIRGYHHLEHVAGGSGVEVPAFCHQCGTPYPWKNRLKIKAGGRATVKPVKYMVDALTKIFSKK